MPHLKHSNNLSTSSIVVVVLDFDPIFSLTVFFFFFPVQWKKKREILSMNLQISPHIFFSTTLQNLSLTFKGCPN